MVDEDGYVWVMGRTDDIINVAGHRLSTGQMEEVLSGHPDIAECAVIGVADALKGQAPLGLVVLKAGVNKPNETVTAELVVRVREHIGPVAAFREARVVARLPKTRRNAWTPPEGCDVAVQEAPLSEGRWLLYAAQRCGERTARLDVAPGKMGALVLRYGETARNATLAGKPVITLVDSKSDTYAAVSALALAGLDVRQAKRCTLLAPEVEGYPIDAYVFDLAPREARKTAALDEPCGAYGRSARTDSYWRLFDGIGAFYVFGDDQPEFDPASLAVYKPSR
jgi:hypothetical protein